MTNAMKCVFGNTRGKHTQGKKGRGGREIPNPLQTYAVGGTQLTVCKYLGMESKTASRIPDLVDVIDVPEIDALRIEASTSAAAPAGTSPLEMPNIRYLSTYSVSVSWFLHQLFFTGKKKNVKSRVRSR